MPTRWTWLPLSVIRWAPQVCEAIRLAKVWVQKVVLPKRPRRQQLRGLLMELLVNNVGDSSAHASDIFVRWLQQCSGPVPSLLADWDALADDAPVDCGQSPRALDPCNPTNNLAM